MFPALLTIICNHSYSYIPSPIHCNDASIKQIMMMYVYSINRRWRKLLSTKKYYKNILNIAPYSSVPFKFTWTSILIAPNSNFTSIFRHWKHTQWIKVLHCPSFRNLVVWWKSNLNFSLWFSPRLVNLKDCKWNMD